MGIHSNKPTRLLSPNEMEAREPGRFQSMPEWKGRQLSPPREAQLLKGQDHRKPLQCISFPFTLGSIRSREKEKKYKTEPAYLHQQPARQYKNQPGRLKSIQVAILCWHRHAFASLWLDQSSIQTWHTLPLTQGFWQAPAHQGPISVRLSVCPWRSLSYVFPFFLTAFFSEREREWDSMRIGLYFKISPGHSSRCTQTEAHINRLATCGG